MTRTIADSAQIVDSTIGTAELREFVTVHDSEIGDGCRIYERVSIKKSTVADAVDINAGAYVENATLTTEVQLGPNCSVVGVSHELSETGMTFREDVFEEVRLGEGVFVGANAVVTPGVEIAAGTVVAAGAVVTHDIGPKNLVVGVPPAQEVIALEEWLR